MNKKHYLIALLYGIITAACLFAPCLPAGAEEQAAAGKSGKTKPIAPKEKLEQLVAELQKNPDDYALREKAIRLALTFKPAPAVPTEARKFEGRAEYALKDAKSETDFLDAAEEYKKALLLAPWIANDYFNQALAYEKGGKFKEAKQGLELYLLAAPNAKDAEDVQKRIAGIEYAIEKKIKDESPDARFQTLKKSLDGSEWFAQPRHRDLDHYFKLQNGELSYWLEWRTDMDPEMAQLNPHLPGTREKLWNGPLTSASFVMPKGNKFSMDNFVTLSEDGELITVNWSGEFSGTLTLVRRR